MKFNKWSLDRIVKGTKLITSRKHTYKDDPHIKRLLDVPLSWWFIRDYLYTIEGADSPEELQRVINGIFRRVVEDDEMFYVHVIDREAVLQ